MNVLTISVAVLLTGILSPAPHPLIGSWTIDYPWHVEAVNGVPKPVMETGRMTVEAQGDSLIATIVTEPTTSFSPRRAIRLAALAGSTPETAVFVTREPVTMSTSNGEQTVTAISTWTFNVSGDRFEGSLDRHIEGMGAAVRPGHRLSGSRARPT